MLYSTVPRISVEFVDDCAPVTDDAAKSDSAAKRALLNDVLRASRERTAGRNQVPLRKEMQIKAHISKQLERREQYLARASALPSPTAAVTPATPPESPAIFHFTLPSPGLSSPLALYESMERSGQSWIEQVDFRNKPKSHMKPSGFQDILTQNQSTSGFFESYNNSSGDDSFATSPRAATFSTGGPRFSLEQINARLQGAILNPAPPRPSRLPAFLARQKAETEVNTDKLSLPIVQVTPSLTVEVSRFMTNKSDTDVGKGQSDMARAARSQEMLEKLRRRVSAPAVLPNSALAVATQQHPVLLLPGGF